MTEDRSLASDGDVGGDPACWLDRVCEVCGAFVEDAEDHDCEPFTEPAPKT